MVEGWVFYGSQIRLFFNDNAWIACLIEHCFLILKFKLPNDEKNFTYLIVLRSGFLGL